MTEGFTFLDLALACEAEVRPRLSTLPRGPLPIPGGVKDATVRTVSAKTKGLKFQASLLGKE